MAVVCLPSHFGPHSVGVTHGSAGCVGHGDHGSGLAFQHLVKPVICATPAYRGHVLQSILASKTKSPPASAGSATTLESTEESEKCSTPYRLPRISPRGTPCTEDSPAPPSTAPESEDKVWGRFGYEDNIRMPELGPSIHKAMMNSPSPVHPSTPGHPSNKGVTGSRSVVAAQQRYRQSAMLVPKFRNAVITPTVSSSYSHNVVREVDNASVHMYKSLLESVANRDPHNPAPTPTPNSRSRSVSPAKSSKSIHWALGSTKHPLFDYKGRGRKQGPYSREFTVHCMAPATWLKMKWGRQRTVVH